jgi:uncharacterized membrane protein
MEWLVVLHVASAIIGIGPTFFMHVLLRKNQTVGEMKQSYSTLNQLLPFPKIVGSIAVLSGITLVIVSGSRFADFWIWSSLVLYVMIQIIVIGMATPLLNKLGIGLKELKSNDAEPLQTDLKALVLRADRMIYVTSALAIVLIIMMVIKPLF